MYTVMTHHVLVFTKIMISFQCPTSGFLLFYEFYNYRRHQAKIAFQCPTSGFLLFYKMQLVHSADMASLVSMPYLGLSSFLPERNNCMNVFTKKFQCPTSGFLLFYFLSQAKREIIGSSVSMPYLGLSSFLQEMCLADLKCEGCFNALPRAFFFSTNNNRL